MKKKRKEEEEDEEEEEEEEEEEGRRRRRRRKKKKEEERRKKKKKKKEVWCKGGRKGVGTCLASSFFIYEGLAMVSSTGVVSGPVYPGAEEAASNSLVRE